MTKQIQSHKYKQLDKYIQSANNIALFGHKSIDGDCIGSMLSFGRICEKMGKKVSYFTPDKPDKAYNFLDDIEKITTNFIYQPYDLCIFLDFSTYDRISSFTKDYMDYFLEQKTIIIDHHIDDNSFAILSIKDKEASSNCEWLLHLYEQLRPEYIDKKVATYLYTGLVTDTGNMTYENNSKETLTNAKKLIEYGADKKNIIFHLFRNRTINTMKLLSKTIERIQTRKNHILATYYHQEELEELGLGTSDSSFLTFTHQNITGYATFVLCKVYKDYIRCSLRSRKKHESPFATEINVGAIAKHLNGGGHKFAAGSGNIMIKSSTQETINEILNTIDQQIQKQLLDHESNI